MPGICHPPFQLSHKSLKSDGGICFTICGFTLFDGGAQVSLGFGYSRIGFSYFLIRFSYSLVGIDHSLIGFGNPLIVPLDLNWKIYHRACEDFITFTDVSRRCWIVVETFAGVIEKLFNGKSHF